MRRILIIFSLVLISFPALWGQELTDAQKAVAEAAEAADKAEQEAASLAPKPKYWTNSLGTDIQFGQTALVNWSAGGYNTISLGAGVDANANYEKEHFVWTNRLQLDYGFLYSADKPVVQKNKDRIYLESKLAYKLKGKFDLSAELNFKSQFSNTFNYPTPTQKADGSELGEGQEYKAKDWKAVRELSSGFVSPAYTNLALGVDYEPWNWLTINLAPLTGGFVIVDDPRLRSSYSMPLKNEDVEIEEGLSPWDEGTYYKSSKFEFGAQLKIDAKVNVNDNFKYETQVVLFSNYLEKPQNIRVNWDNKFEWVVHKFFSLILTTSLIYDDDVMITKYANDGSSTTHQRVQFNEGLTFGFAYTFETKK